MHPFLRQVCILFACYIHALSLHGQQEARGVVRDAQTKEPLAFVNIHVNGDPSTGTVSDIDGRFAISHHESMHTLTFSYVGYTRHTISLAGHDSHKELTVELHAAEITLREVVIVAGENPAYRIIREVIRNKGRNNPELLPAFTYKTFNKVMMDYTSSGTGRADTMLLRMNRFLRGGHIFAMESVTERKYLRPDKSAEVILATRVSGFRRPEFAPLATDLQPFSFYAEVIPILDAQFLNPISDGALSRYEYRLEDTVYHHRDTVFVISYHPRPEKHFEGLTGLMYINTNMYAIQCVTAEPATEGLTNVRIQQQYVLVDNKQWFPHQLHFEVHFGQMLKNATGLRASGRSYISDVDLNPSLTAKDFPLATVTMHPQAQDRDSLWWDMQRLESRTLKEAITYQVMDSLGQKHRFDNKAQFFNNLFLNRIQAGPFDIDISRTLVFNRYEGMRLGTGIYTNARVMRHVSLGVYGGYGLRDHAWKYGGECIIDIQPDREWRLKIGYDHALQETGRSGLNIFNRRYDVRSVIASQMDGIQKTSVTMELRPARYVQAIISGSHSKIAPQYAYAFQEVEGRSITDYMYSDVTIGFRYAFGEKLMHSLDQYFSLGTKYPVFTIAHTSGLRNVFDGDLEFNKTEARVEYSLLSGHLGTTNVRVEGGLVNGDVPMGLLFAGEGAYDRGIIVRIPNYFQTLTPYEFLSDQYVHLHVSQHFGARLLQIGKFKPHVSLHHSMGWGALSDPERHQDIAFSTMEKGYFESGLHLDNLLRINYLGIAYLGIGGGVYCRYGAYAHGSTRDNLVFKLSFVYTTR